jgi:hypothetical protein
MSASPTSAARSSLACLGASLLLLIAACAARAPVIDRGDKPPEGTGTIAGFVRAEGSNAPLSARRVTATDVKSGAKFETSTASNGGYTIKVPVGRYRVEVELRAGEGLAEGPGELDINRSDVDSARNFVIRAGGVNHN